ncbi:tRNA (adenine(58)-N(1))-methyltransferase, mitochondrial isoform X1 [Seriola aureovittata]|uniref:tRNA (adenine(58)-N(1))-methyltransferase, mitochondrial isoform X1 n=1 Tax=Seriola aureovittata TaxID=2871759 RepID=UPI0024BED0B1|nr:tRNA (adenine(58)-N(1))-methyltransferase, mitochondrial isoform X1 [Seriola aureovittata]XP_056248658.1 tRNA (adenine(58)-N(1))-methyltransferase, mitochondrial isoform X1 [Seriola aureovittata]
MAVQMPFGGFLFMHRLMRTCTSSQRHLRHGEMLVNLTTTRQEIRTFSTSSVRCNNKEREDSDSSRLSTKLTSKQALLARRRRPLSPLERISGLLPQDALSPEVMQLREQNQQEAEGGNDTQGSVTHRTQQESGHTDTLAADKTTPKGEESDNHHASDVAMVPNTSESRTSATLPGDSLIVFGELLIAEYYKKGQVEFRKMFKPQKGTRLHSSWGFILHDNIVGLPAGQFLKTSMGLPILIRRASLEDYVLYMRRAPAIAYPKDATTMLMMMDVTEGDRVLESGSGSGAMSLFLSRAVGSKGSVLSVEVREDHLRRAMLNYSRWRTSWSLRRGEDWPDNVQFHNADLCTASSLLAGQGFHAIALDLTNPHLVLPTVIPHLHPGAVCAVYLANVTQVVDLLEGIRCLALPLLCECIIEVPIRHWLVAPARQKNGRYCTRKAPILEEDHSEEEEEEERTDQTDEEDLAADEHPAFGGVPYIARPCPKQLSHTAFLVKLRKFVQ